MSDPTIGNEQGGQPAEFVDTPDDVQPGDKEEPTLDDQPLEEPVSKK